MLPRMALYSLEELDGPAALSSAAAAAWSSVELASAAAEALPIGCTTSSLRRPQVLQNDVVFHASLGGSGSSGVARASPDGGNVGRSAGVLWGAHRHGRVLCGGWRQREG